MAAARNGSRKSVRSRRIPLTSLPRPIVFPARSEEHTSELQSLRHLVCRLLLEKKKHVHESSLLRSSALSGNIRFISVAATVVRAIHDVASKVSTTARPTAIAERATAPPVTSPN